MDISNIPSHVYAAVYQNLGGNYEEDSDEKADRMTRRIEKLSSKELFDRFLIWNGIIGYTEEIIAAYEGTIGFKET